MLIEYTKCQIKKDANGVIGSHWEAPEKIGINFEPLPPNHREGVFIVSGGFELMIPNLSGKDQGVNNREFQRYILENGYHPLSEYDIVRYARSQIRDKFRRNILINGCGSFPDAISRWGKEACEIKYSKSGYPNIRDLLKRNSSQVCRHAQATFKKTCFIYLFNEATLKNGFMEYYKIKIIDGGEILYFE